MRAPDFIVPRRMALLPAAAFELAQFLRRFLSRPDAGRAEKNNRVLHSVPPQALLGFQVFGHDAQRAGVGAFEEALVPVRHNGQLGVSWLCVVSARHGSPPRTRSTS